MEELKSWSQLFYESLQNFGATIMEALPQFIGAIMIILIGWLFAKLISGAISRVLRITKFDELAEKINTSEFLKKANITTVPSKLIGKFVYWVILLFVVITAADTLGWNSVANEISNLISYLPRLFVAIVFFIVGTYIATFVRDLIAGASSSLGIGAGKIISSFVFYLLFIIVSLTALGQAGLDTSIITSNLLIIMGAVLATAAISYGFASRDILSNILAGFFNKRTYKIGQTIEVNGVKGKIVEASNITVIVQTSAKEKVVVPMQQLLNNQVRIFE